MPNLPPPKVAGRSWPRFLIGFAVLWGVLAGLGEIDATGRWGLVILAAVATTAVVVEVLIYKTPAREAVRDVGLGRPNPRAVGLAAVVSLLIMLVYPLTSAVTGAQIQPVPNWPWILLGIFAFNGLAEEIVWRGFAFRRLSAGRPFRTAVLLTMPLIAAAHIPIVVNNGVVVAIGAMLVAAVTSIPFSYLYVTGRCTVWAPALVHTAIDSFKIMVIPGAAVTTFSMLLIAVSIAVPLLALTVPRRVLEDNPAPATDKESVR
jgi:membrane protease YdiL (CAAX protease family)